MTVDAEVRRESPRSKRSRILAVADRALRKSRLRAHQMGVDRRRGRDRPDRAVSLFRVEGALPVDDHETRVGRLRRTVHVRNRWSDRSGAGPPRRHRGRAGCLAHRCPAAPNPAEPHGSACHPASVRQGGGRTAALSGTGCRDRGQLERADRGGDRGRGIRRPRSADAGPTGPGVGHQRLALVPTERESHPRTDHRNGRRRGGTRSCATRRPTLSIRGGRAARGTSNQTEFS